mmetsp:Transcript_13756/g.23453  ORF Transcript_13756/g.23453 Transcript_13756/m.23453 type:complete len:202 (-) Transcript_13756:1112-1717(-)
MVDFWVSKTATCFKSESRSSMSLAFFSFIAALGPSCNAIRCSASSARFSLASKLDLSCFSSLACSSLSRACSNAAVDCCVSNTATCFSSVSLSCNAWFLSFSSLSSSLLLFWELPTAAAATVVSAGALREMDAISLWWAFARSRSNSKRTELRRDSKSILSFCKSEMLRSRLRSVDSFSRLVIKYSRSESSKRLRNEPTSI